MDYGQKIGVSTYYKYLDKFGFLEKTKIDLPGEASGIFLKEEKVGPVELATISFGQRFEVTPIQMAKMVATIANKGKEVNPRIVKATVDSQTKERKNIPVAQGEQVISEKTAETVFDMMTSVVEEGTGKNAKVEGYTIGGKTGTSEDGVNTNKYVTSFVGIAGKDEPEIAIIVILYNPTGKGGHQGGAVAAPIASQILGEVLPYITENKTEESALVEIPELTGITIKEAKKTLIDMELNFESKDESEEAIIRNQLPKKGIQVPKGTKVILYTNEE